MIPVQQRREGAVGECGGHVAQLAQAVGAQLPDPFELAGLELRSYHDVGQQGEAARREARQPW